MKRKRIVHSIDERQGQVPTSKVTVKAIMVSPLFARGVADVRAGKGFPSDYDEWSDDLWAYERGRAWATAAPRGVPLMRNGEISIEALRWWTDII
jgi:hypothetical protein